MVSLRSSRALFWLKVSLGPASKIGCNRCWEPSPGDRFSALEFEGGVGELPPVNDPGRSDVDGAVVELVPSPSPPSLPSLSPVSGSTSGSSSPSSLSGSSASAKTKSSSLSAVDEGEAAAAGGPPARGWGGGGPRGRKVPPGERRVGVVDTGDANSPESSMLGSSGVGVTSRLSPAGGG